MHILIIDIRDIHPLPNENLASSGFWQIIRMYVKFT